MKKYGEGDSEDFPEELFQEFISRAEVCKDGTVNYHLIFELEQGMPETYADYVELKRQQKKQKTKEKHEALLKGPEVQELLVFCGEPQSIKEIVDFMNERMVISDTKIFQVILRPLMKQGKLDRFKAPEKGGTREVFHYHVCKDSSFFREKSNIRTQQSRLISIQGGGPFFVLWSEIFSNLVKLVL